VTRLPRASGKEVISALQRGGFEITHIRGSHHYLRKPDTGPIVPVPVHGSRDLPLGTLRSILRLAGLTPEQFDELLR
jgi:predicted RNA binding protein YcfA (HicA-like mRNA interferase family)